jgi:hypothetical protein
MSIEKEIADVLKKDGYVINEVIIDAINELIEIAEDERDAQDEMIDNDEENEEE